MRAALSRIVSISSFAKMFFTYFKKNLDANSLDDDSTLTVETSLFRHYYLQVPPTLNPLRLVLKMDLLRIVSGYVMTALGTSKK